MKITSWPNTLGFDLLGDGVDTEVHIFSDSIGVRNNVSGTWLQIPTSFVLMGRCVPLDFAVETLSARCTDSWLEEQCWFKTNRADLSLTPPDHRGPRQLVQRNPTPT